MDKLLITGTPLKIAEQFDAYTTFGAERLIVAPIDGTWTAQSQRIADAIHR